MGPLTGVVGPLRGWVRWHDRGFTWKARWDPAWFSERYGYTTWRRMGVWRWTWL